MKKLFVLLACLCLTVALSVTAFAWSYPTSTPTAPFAGGTGTESDPYIINTAQQLANMAYLVNNDNATYGDKCYKLGANIDLSGGNWTPMGYYKSDSDNVDFMGIFDGAGYTISNMNIIDPFMYAGLFGCIRGGNVKDVILTNVSADITMTTFSGVTIGGVVGFIENGTVENCFVDGAIKGTTTKMQPSTIGGIAGYTSDATTKILNCVSNCTITAMGTYNACAGGIVGSVHGGIVQNCYNVGVLSAAANGYGSYAGGVCGDNGGKIQNCYNIGNVSAKDDGTSGFAYAGGVVGIISGTTDSCYHLNTIQITLDATTKTTNEASTTFSDASTLVTHLNNWISQQSTPAAYRTWKVSAGENSGYPVLSNYWTPPHTHDYNTKQWDTNDHWDECSCGGKQNVTPHAYDNACDTDCNVCSATRTVGGHVSTGNNVATYDKKAVCDACGVEYGEKVTRPITIPTYTPSEDVTIQSAKTFDAGIALYAGMALMSAAGAVYVTKKHH